MPSPRLLNLRVQLPGRFYDADSPVGGIARGVFAGLLVLAEQLRREQRLPNDCAITLARVDGAPITETGIAAFLAMPLELVQPALAELVHVGELVRLTSGALSLPRFAASQCSPAALRKRRQRARKRAAKASAAQGAPGQVTRSRDVSRVSRVEAPLHVMSGPGHRAAVAGFRWYGQVAAAGASFAPGTALGSRWTEAYAVIGSRPESERHAVLFFIAPKLRSGELRLRRLTPRHLADYWPVYLACELPFKIEASSSQLELPSAAEYERAALEQAAARLEAPL